MSLKSDLKRFLSFLIILFSCFMVNAQELTKELAWAIKYGQTQYLEDWIPDDKINACFGTGRSKTYSVLAMSIKLNSMESLLYFIDRGANPDKACEDKTPLMYCAKYNRPDMLRFLIEQGADPYRKRAGKSALFFARKFNNYDVVKELKRLAN